MAGKDRLAQLAAKRQTPRPSRPQTGQRRATAVPEAGEALAELALYAEASSFSGPSPHAGTQVILMEGRCQDVLRPTTAPTAWADVVVADPGVGDSRDLPGWHRQVPGSGIWQSILGAAKPGAHLALFGGTRHYHRAVCEAEDAGWEMRAVVSWHYAKGMPMSLDIGQAVAKKRGEEATPYFRTVGAMTDAQREAFIEQSAGNEWWGWGTELRPSTELIALMRRPLTKSSVAANVMAHGTGAINIDAIRIDSGERDAIATHIPDGQGDAHGLALQKFQAAVGTTTLGRWPADAIFEHDEDCGSACTAKCAVAELDPTLRVSRFFYCPKSSRSEKDLGGRPKGNTHKSVKPVKVLDWILSALLPPNGVVLDPFCGTSTTGLSALRLDARAYVGIDTDPTWHTIGKRRLMAVDDLS